MAWVYPHLVKRSLIAYLRTHTNVAAGRHYGVSHTTVRLWRQRHHLPPFSRGSDHRSRVAATLLRCMQPGQWYGFAVLRQLCGATRQQVYTMLHRLTQDGALVRHGEPGAYIWQRVRPHTRRYR